jgi:hypothetical protein
MAIHNLKPTSVTNFLGKNTQQNLVDAPLGTLAIAKNVVIQNDQQLSKAPGYTKVKQVGSGPIRAHYDFQRNVDGKQFVLVQSGSEIWAMNADGTNPQLLVSGVSATGVRFVNNAFAAYGSDGAQAWRLVDTGAGGLTAYKWGIDAPLTAPAIAVSAGTLTAQNGYRYVRCFVSRFTDSLGIQRLSISAPSPMSAHSGPFVNGVANLSAMNASSDAQVTHQWIFRTTDSPLNTSATFFFLEEIPASQTTFGDSLTDDALDTTRIADFDANPAPPAPIITTFQNRVVLLDPETGLIRFSNGADAAIGIPEEGFALSNFFSLPSGNRQGTAMIPAQQGTVLLVASPDYWYSYKGYNATTFTEQDRVAAPGVAGRDAVCDTPFGIAWLSPSKRLWMWNGASSPTDLSSIISQSGLPLSYGMDDLSAADLSRAVVRWFSYGSTHFLAVFVRTSGAPDADLNLIQVWSVDVSTQASSGEYGAGSSVYGQIKGIYQTDKLPAVSITAASSVLVNSVPYIFLGDAAGNVYRYPDGFQDDTAAIGPAFATGWMNCEFDGKKRFYFADIVTNVANAADSFRVFAKIADTPDNALLPVELEWFTLPDPRGQQTSTIRAKLCGAGRFVQLFVSFPDDNQDALVRKLDVYSQPLYMGMP